MLYVQVDIFCHVGMISCLPGLDYIYSTRKHHSDSARGESRAYADPEGGGGAGVQTPPPPEKSQNLGFFSNTSPDP